MSNEKEIQAPAQADPLEKLTRLQEEMGLYDEAPAQADACCGNWAAGTSCFADPKIDCPRLLPIREAPSDDRREAEDELNCAEEILDGYAAHLDMEQTAFDCIGDYITAVVEATRKAAQSAGEVERGDVVAFEFYNRATGHAIVDYSVNTHVGNLSAAKGYEARPLVYAAPRQNVLDGSKPIPAWQAREALDELEAAARGDASFNHQAAAVVRAALSHKEQP